MLYDPPDDIDFGDLMREIADSITPRRNVRDLRISELVPAQRTSHSKRPPIIIDEQPIEETLRQRIDREVEELTLAVAELASQLSKRTKQLEQLKMFPEKDPFVDGDVITFHKKFPNGEKLFSYAAQRTDGLWYITGNRSPQGITWDKFVNWMGLGVSGIYNARTGEKVIG